MSAKAHGLYACSHRRFSPSGEILSYDQYNYYGSNYRHKDCAPIFGYLFVWNRLIFFDSAAGADRRLSDFIQLVFTNYSYNVSKD